MLFLVPLFVSGCSTQWVKTRADATAFGDADESCTSKSESKYPVRNEVAQKTKYASRREACTKNDYCNKGESKWVQSPEVESYAMDVNEDSRYQHYSRCMRAEGWEEQTNWKI